MGQAALVPGSIDKLPDPIDEETARRFVGKCWDDADWESITGGSGKVCKSTFVTTVNIRNHAPSLRSWLEFWRIDELTERMEELEVMSADDLLDIDSKTMAAFVASLKTVQKVHWGKALAHAAYLKAQPLGYMPWRPEGLMMFLESWRLQRLQPQLFDLGVDVKEDLMDLEQAEWGSIDFRLLERKRWDEAIKNLVNLVQSFNYAEQRKASIPTISTWLKSLHLGKIKDKIEAYGAVELVDLDDVDERQFAELNLTKLQAKHWKVGLNQIAAAKREAMADGKADLPNFRGFLENWRLLRLHDQLIAMGAVVQQDLLDLDPSEYALIEMRPLEAKRFEQMMVALEEEFETPPPGEEWTKENMTRRAWRKQNAETYGYSMATTGVAKPILASKTVGAAAQGRMNPRVMPDSARSSNKATSLDPGRGRMRSTR